MTTLAWIGIAAGVLLAGGGFVLWCCLVVAGRADERGQGR